MNVREVLWGIGQPETGFGLFPLQFAKAIKQGRGFTPVYDDIDDLLDLPFDPLQCALIGFGGCPPLVIEPIGFLLEVADCFLGGLRRDENCLQAVEYALFDHLTFDRVPVFAGPAPEMIGAAIAVVLNDHVIAAAHAATQEPGEQEALAMLAIESVREGFPDGLDALLELYGKRGLPVLCGFPG